MSHRVESNCVLARLWTQFDSVAPAPDVVREFECQLDIHSHGISWICVPALQLIGSEKGRGLRILLDVNTPCTILAILEFCLYASLK